MPRLFTTSPHPALVRPQLHRPLQILACLVLLASVRLAHAQMWIFVDERGAKHFASSQVDKRYTPLLGSMPDPSGGLANSGAHIESRLAASTASIRTVAAMEISPAFMAVKQHLRTAAEVNQLDEALLQAVIATESGFDARAVSPRGATGLMQLMPATAERYGVTNDGAGTVSAKLTDPKTNIHAGARYLRDLVNLFPGQLELAVAAYNAGEGAVQRAGNKVPNYPETKNYVRNVMQLYKQINQQTQRAQIGAYLLIRRLVTPPDIAPDAAPVVVALADTAPTELSN